MESQKPTQVGRSDSRPRSNKNKPASARSVRAQLKPKEEPQYERPWLDQAGRVLPDEELKAIFSKWSIETWDLYLTETVDTPHREEEVQSDQYWDLLEQMVEFNWDGPSTLPYQIEVKIRGLVNRLEKYRRKIIRGKFWWSLSNRILAKRLGFSNTKVVREKKAALAEIELQVGKDRSTTSYLIGGSEKQKPCEQTHEQQIAEVYVLELNGSYTR